jgi:hypothetical protein
MKTKELYVICVNCGDGSSYPRYTFDKSYLDKLETKFDEEDPNFDYEALSDGDGFHYDTLTVPEECTLESLNIAYDFAKDENIDW